MESNNPQANSMNTNSKNLSNTGSIASNLNNNNNSKKSKKLKKKGILTRSKLFTNKAVSRLKKNSNSKMLSSDEFFKVGDKGMVPVEQYRDEIIQKERDIVAAKKEAEEKGLIFEDNGEITMPPLELTEYLKDRRKLKETEFKKLQKQHQFYFSKILDERELNQIRQDEGLYLLGINLNLLFDLMNQNVYLDKETKKKYGKDGLSQGLSYELIGEYVDMDKYYPKLKKDKMGLRLGPDKALFPEKIFNQKSKFDNILRESKKYTGFSDKFITPRGLLNMVRILDKYKKNEEQWLRVCTAVDIIYKYLSRGDSRKVFFSNKSPLNTQALQELDEFYKTEHLFMSLQDFKEYREELSFYKHDYKNKKNKKDKKIKR